jgi:predicted negative regulator of RcsB-dependent stress response
MRRSKRWRAAMERMAAAGPRVQLALGRVQLQEQRINTLIRRLDEIRTTAVAAQTDHDRGQRLVRSSENELRNAAICGTLRCSPQPSSY